MKKNQGSALITVLIFAAFIMIIGTSLISVTQSEFIMAKSSNDSNAAYYVAEAGIERALNIMKVTHPISSVLEGLENPTKSNIDDLVAQYFSDENSDYMYPYLNAAAVNDRDTLTDSNGVDSYYEISFNTNAESSLDAENKYSKVIYITSKGYYGSNSVRTITSKYTIEGSLTSDSQSGSDDIFNEDLEHFYSLNAVNIIDNSSDCNFQGVRLELDADAFFSTNKFILGPNCVINENGMKNIAIIANSMTKGQSNYNFNNIYAFFDGDSTKLKLPSIDNGKQLFVSDSVDTNNCGNNIPKNKLTDLFINANLYKGGWPIAKDPAYSILNKDYTHFRDFSFNSLPDNIDFEKILEDPNISKNVSKNVNIFYYNSGNNMDNVITVISRNTAYLNDKHGNPGNYTNGNQNYTKDYDILVSHGDLNINFADNNLPYEFQGIIYCDGVININKGNLNNNCDFWINGILIARGINCNGNFKATYASPPGSFKLEDRLLIIKDIYNGSSSSGSGSTSGFNLDSISCTAWDMH